MTNVSANKSLYKTLLAWAAILSVFLMFAAPISVSAQPASKSAEQSNLTLVWSDEFDGNSLNLSNWSFETGGGGFGNNERQLYTNGQNASVAGGVLTITATRINSGSCWYGTCQYASTRINTQGKRQFQYGRVEARIALPAGQGFWPAFWMLGSNIGSVGWPTSGELDIMENRGAIPGTGSSAIHGPGYSGATPFNHATNISPTQFNVYAVEWDTNQIRFFVNGGLHYTVTRTQIQQRGNYVFDQPFYILLNLAVGGNFGGDPNNTTPFPSRMQVDYVRVFQAGNGGGPTPTPVPGATWFRVVNRGSGKCVDARGAATANGTAVQQFTCNTSFAQQWQFQATSGGFVRVNNRNNANQVWDVSNVSAADNALIHLWAFGGGNNQQWQQVSEAGGFFHFISRLSGKCLDVPGASTADSVQLVQFTCNGTGAQSFSRQPQP